MAIYLNYDGVKGDVTSAGHEDWIEVSSMQWGVGRGIHTPTGSSQERESSAPSISEVTCTLMMGKSTPALFTEACVGIGKTVKIDLVQTGSKMQTYMSYTLTETLISGYSMSSGGDRPSESVSFNFTKIEMKYTPYDNTNEPGSPIPAGYNISTGAKV
jgi:type VI secretion system secreted protein Hcp